MDKIFFCKMCGHCCHGESTVSLSREEMEGIAAFFCMSIRDFIDEYCIIKGARVEMKVVKGHCIFYSENGLCAIHPVKPGLCRTWPLHPSILSDRAAWQAIQADCPGFSRDAVHEDVCALIKSRDT
jgi:Fe-S-cluster containining protein